MKLQHSILLFEGVGADMCPLVSNTKRFGGAEYKRHHQQGNLLIVSGNCRRKKKRSKSQQEQRNDGFKMDSRQVG